MSVHWVLFGVVDLMSKWKDGKELWLIWKWTEIKTKTKSFLCHNCEVWRDEKWLKVEVMCSCREGAMSRQVGRQVGEYRSTASNCVPGQWKMDEDQWEDERVERWRDEWVISQQLNRVLSYLPVWGVCVCAESGADWEQPYVWAVVTPDCITPPIKG